MGLLRIHSPGTLNIHESKAGCFNWRIPTLYHGKMGVSQSPSKKRSRLMMFFGFQSLRVPVIEPNRQPAPFDPFEMNFDPAKIPPKTFFCSLAEFVKYQHTPIKNTRVFFVG